MRHTQGIYAKQGSQVSKPAPRPLQAPRDARARAGLLRRAPDQTHLNHLLIRAH